MKHNTEKIKVLLVDDHTMVRDALATVLQQVDDFQVVGSFSSAEELLNKLRIINPDVVIMDILLKGMTGIEATRWIKDRDPSVKIIFLSSEVTREFVSAGIQSGIDGYLPKAAGKSMLIDAIRAVASGEKYFNEAVTKLVFEDFYRKERTSRETKKQLSLTDLTKRELEVLSLIANGRSNKEAADELFISIKTVDTHKTHILDKLGLKNTAELVKYAIVNNLIDISEPQKFSLK